MPSWAETSKGSAARSRLIRSWRARARADGHGATLLHYVSANGVEGYRQKTPPNVVEITKLLLAAGADVNAKAHCYGGGDTTLGLTATSMHPANAGVMIPMLETLVAAGGRREQQGRGLGERALRPREWAVGGRGLARGSRRRGGARGRRRGRKAGRGAEVRRGRRHAPERRDPGAAAERVRGCGWQRTPRGGGLPALPGASTPESSPTRVPPRCTSPRTVGTRIWSTG